MTEATKAPSKTTELKAVKTVTAEVFRSEESITGLLDEVRKEIGTIKMDPGTKKGLEQIRSVAARIASSKVSLDDAGKSAIAEYKAKISAYDGNRKLWRDTMDTIKAEVRQPLTEIEEAEKKRKAEIQARIDNIAAMGTKHTEADDPEAIAGTLADLDAIEIDDNFGDVTQRADADAQKARAWKAVRTTLDAAQARVKQEEADRLAREKAEQEAAAQRQREAAQAAIQQEADTLAQAGSQYVDPAQHNPSENWGESEIEYPQQTEGLYNGNDVAPDQSTGFGNYERAPEPEPEPAPEPQADPYQEAARQVHRVAASALMTHAALSQDQARAVVSAIVRGQIPAVTINYN